jgi:hypothetical protein
MSNHAAGSARLAELLQAYGGDPLRWPAHERAAMREAMQQAGPQPDDARGASLHAQAAALDQTLATLDAVPDVPHLRRAVLLAVAQEPHRASQSMTQRLLELWQALGGARLAAPALTLALAAGIGLGWSLEPTETDADELALIELAQLDDAYAAVLQ